MRAYVTYGVKLVGVIFVYIGLMKIPRFVPWIDLPHESGLSLYHVIYEIWPAAVAVIGGLILLFKPQIIANRIRSDADVTLADEGRSLLKTGVILIGLYFFMNNLPALTWFIWEDIPWIVVQPFWITVSFVLKLYLMLVPLYLIFGSDRIVNWITREREVEKAA